MNQRSVKISLIVPCYGVEKYLDRCIKSLVNQTIKDIEIILIDDESLDNVPKMCDEYANRDSRIKVIHKKNGGLGFARNTGLDIARGEYVAFVDSDDFVEIDMFKTLYEDAKCENADVVFCNMQREDKKGKWIYCREINERRIFKGVDVKHFMLDIVASAPKVHIERICQMSVWHAIYRRSIIEDNNIRFLSERQVASEDMPFDVDYLSKCKTVVYRPECFYHYCLNGNSLTAKYLPEKFERYKNLYKYLKERLNVYGNDGIYRVNRFFIGMIRTQILQLAKVDYFNKKAVLKNISKDMIWNEIMKDFKCSWIPTPAAIMLWLTVHQKNQILLIYLKIYNFMRNLK